MMDRLLLAFEFLLGLLSAIGAIACCVSTASTPAHPPDKLQLSKEMKITEASQDNCTIFSCEAVLPQPLEIAWLSCKDHADCKPKLLQKDKHLNFTDHEDCMTSRSDAIGISSSTQFKGLIVCRKTSDKSSYTFKALGRAVTVQIDEDGYTNLPRIAKLRNSSMYIDAVVLNTPYFVADPIDVTCGASNILFHSPPQIMLVHASGEPSEVSGGEPWRDSDVIGTETMIHLASLNVTAVVCRAQRWDTGEWEQASYPLDVRAPIPIRTLNSSAPVIQLKGNERNVGIFCKIEGGPPPPVLWERDCQMFEGDMTTTIFTFGVVAQITFPRATYEKHGYKKNIAGDYVLYAEDDGNNREMCRIQIIIESKERKHGNEIFIVVSAIAIVALATITIIVALAFKKKFKFPTSSIFETSSTASATLPNVTGVEDSQLDVVLPPEEKMPPFSDGSKAIPSESLTEATYHGSALHLDGRFGNVSGDAIVIGECIGAGTSGSVYKGKLDGRNVAVKRLVNNGKERLRIVTREHSILASIGSHPNIIELVTTILIPNAFGPRLHDIAIVMECCENGDLRTYLRKYREFFKDEVADDGSRRLMPTSCSSGYTHLSEISANCVSTSDLLQWTVQLACAMDYLASKHIVHGDLALRNLLLTGSKELKVSDFGLSKRLDRGSEYYKMKSDERIPWANCAPEFLDDCKASTATDVWAFGVATWEMFTLGETPYLEDFDACSYSFRNALKKGHRLLKPAYANAAIYDIMLMSWHVDPKQRPSFEKLICALKEEYLSFVGDLSHGTVSFDDNTAANEIGS